jgi:hypothetical protein
VNSNTTPIPEPIAQLQRQLDQFRSTQSHRAKIPEPLWQAAVELARVHGLHPVAHPLRLDYMGLKKRVNVDLSPVRRPSPQRKATKMSFVELTPAPAKFEECVIEFESAAGSKMRIQWRPTSPPDWTSLLRAWREAEG